MTEMDSSHPSQPLQKNQFRFVFLHKTKTPTAGVEAWVGARAHGGLSRERHSDVVVEELRLDLPPVDRDDHGGHHRACQPHRRVLVDHLRREEIPHHQVGSPGPHDHVRAERVRARRRRQAHADVCAVVIPSRRVGSDRHRNEQEEEQEAKENLVGTVQVSPG